MVIQEVILCKFGEVVLKGANRQSFESQLIKELRRRASPHGVFKIYFKQSTVYVEPLNDSCDMDGMYEAAKKVFGIVGVNRAAVCEKNIDDILNMSVEEAISFFGSQEDSVARRIAERLQPLVDVGLSYIKLGQSSSTLSGGESQRVKLAYFLSMSGDAGSRSKPQRILFIFDEPTTGLHFYDVEKLLKSFDALLSKGHSIVVVEHNLDVIRAADWVIDLGPEAGDGGGNLVYAGRPEDIRNCKESHTAGYL